MSSGKSTQTTSASCLEPHRTFETRSKELSSRDLSDLWVLFLVKKHSGKPGLYWLDSDHIIRSKHLSSRRRCRCLTSDRCVCRRCSLRRSARPAARRPPPAVGPLTTTRPPPASPIAYLSPQRNSTFQPFAQLIQPLLVRVSPALQPAHAYLSCLSSAPSASSSLTRLLTPLLCPIDFDICPFNVIPAPLRIISANYLPKHPSIRITQIAQPGVHHSIHSRPLRRAFP